MLDYVRVTDIDTGHKLTIQRSQLHTGNYRELKADAVDHHGDPLPPEFDAVKARAATANHSDDPDGDDPDGDDPDGDDPDGDEPPDPEFLSNSEGQSAIDTTEKEN